MLDCPRSTRLGTTAYRVTKGLHFCFDCIHPLDISQACILIVRRPVTEQRYHDKEEKKGSSH